MSAVEYVIPADPGNGHAQWDEGKCPKCGAGTLIAWVNGTAYRHCSYVKCDWGLANDVIVASHNDCDRTPN